jgi:hypothetical protein
MDVRSSHTPPATARPKHSSSPIASTYAAGSSQQSSSTMAASSRTARGNTPAASRSATKLVDAEKPTRPTSRDSLTQKMLKKTEEAPRPSKAEEVDLVPRNNGTKDLPANAAQQLKALKSEFDGLRSHLTCKICDRLLYQPYTISCGHTYCYTVRRASGIWQAYRLIRYSVSVHGSPTTRIARHVLTVALLSKSCPLPPMS